jgi:hypothetical protein
MENIFSATISGLSYNASWDYNLRDLDRRFATWRGTDVNIDQGPSLLGVGKSFESSYTDLVLESDGPTTYSGDVVSIQDFRAYARTQEYDIDVVRHVSIRGGSLSLTGLGAGVYLLYWDRFANLIFNVLDVLVVDKTLQTGLYQGIPIAKVTFDGVDVTDLQSSFAFTYNRKDTQTLTVGQGGMFETIQAACYWIETHDPVTRHIELVSDIVSDALYGGDSYVPSGVTIDGNGYTITLSNYVSPVNKPLFYLRGLDSNVASRGVTFKNLRIIFDNVVGQTVAGLVLDNAASPPNTSSDFGVILENVYYNGDTGGGSPNVLSAIVFGQYTLDLTVRNSYFEDVDIALAGFAGCRRYYVENSEFISILGNLAGFAALFALSSTERLYVSNVNYSSSTSPTELCSFVRNALGQNTTGCTIHIENTRANMNLADFMVLDNTVVGVRTDLSLTKCRITTENESQQYIAGVTRRVFANIKSCEFLRLAPTGSAPTEGFIIGDDTGGGQASYWSFDSCLINSARLTATSYAGLQVLVKDCVVSGLSNILGNSGSGIGTFQLQDNTWTGGVLNFQEWRVSIDGGSYTNTASIIAPFVQLVECDVSIVGGIRFSKTSTDTNPIIRFRLACAADISDVYLEHGNGATGSPTAIQVNSDASFTRFHISNLGMTYLGTAIGSGASGLEFIPAGSPVQASFTLTGFIFRGYPVVGATASTALSFNSNWSLFTIASGFTISGGAGVTTFEGSGAPTDFYIETSARFIP